MIENVGKLKNNNSDNIEYSISIIGNMMVSIYEYTVSKEFEQIIDNEPETSKKMDLIRLHGKLSKEYQDTISFH